MAEVVNTNQFRNGMHIGLDGGVWPPITTPPDRMPEER